MISTCKTPDIYLELAQKKGQQQQPNIAILQANTIKIHTILRRELLHSIRSYTQFAREKKLHTILLVL